MSVSIPVYIWITAVPRSVNELFVLTLFVTTLKLVTVAICLVLGVNVSLFFRLKMYVQARFDHVKVFMKVEGRKANSVR